MLPRQNTPPHWQRPVGVIINRMAIRSPDSEYAEPFRAYSNYFETLAGVIEDLYGVKESLTSAVHTGVAQHPKTTRVQRRRLDLQRSEVVEASFRKSWSMLRRLDRELEDSEIFDEEANAWLPEQSYYAIYHAVLGFAAASRQVVPRDHAAVLRLAGSQVTRGAFPSPWNAWCSGYPPAGPVRFGGIDLSGDSVHVLSSPRLSTSSDRIAMFLRTTRRKELERRFEEQRRIKVPDGRLRRNLSKQHKERTARKMAPTTLFDIFWRIRTKVHYGDADTFVLGASGKDDARRFGQALITVTDATVAAIEGLAAAHIGPDLLAGLAAAYAHRTSSTATSTIGRRADSW